VGAGFIGAHIAGELLGTGIEVRALDVLHPQVHAGRPGYLPADVELVVEDLRDPAVTRRALQGIDAVIHLAARVGVGQSMYELVEYSSTNALGTAVLLEELVAHPVERLVVASSMSVYGEGRYIDSAGRPHDDVTRTREQLEAGRWDPSGGGKGPALGGADPGDRATGGHLRLCPGQVLPGAHVPHFRFRLPGADHGAAALRQAERQGVRPITDDEAAPLLAFATRSEDPGLVAVAADFDRYAAYVGRHPRAALVSSRPGTESETVRPRGWLRRRLDAEAPAARTGVLHEAIGAVLREVLGEAGQIDETLAFTEMGLDSITTIDLRTHLAQALDTELPSTAAIDHPTISALAAFVLDRLSSP
jgi:acyl carrier protein